MIIQKKLIKGAFAVACAAALSFPLSVLGADSEAKQSTAKVYLANPKLSKPLLDVVKPLPKLTPARKNKMSESGERIPGLDFFNEVPNKNFPFAKEVLERSANIVDPVIQSKVTSRKNSAATTPEILASFNGMDNVQGAVPPDTNGDVGPNHYVQMVNTALAIWDKQGNQLIAPVAINSLWDGFGGLCESTNRGDPIVLYDSAADRWLLSQFAFNSSFTDNHQCIAISQTGDPTGAYYLYDFFYSDTKFNDYPHYGVWHDGYYAGVNQFENNSYVGAGVVAYERDKMLLGQPAQQVIFDLEQSFPDAFTPMPADIDGIFMPPTSMPQYFVASGDGTNMDIYTFSVDWDDIDNSDFELLDSVDVAPYNGAVCGFSRDCVVQPGTPQRLDSISQRMMFRFAYRNLGGTQHKLIANHTVAGEDATIPGVRWYEFDVDNAGAVSLANNGTMSLGDGVSRWMGSAAMDAVGNIAVAYSASSDTVFPSLRVSGRGLGDVANTLTVPELELKAGEGSQTGANRWGDYSSLSVDPADDCTFWFTTEYYKAGNNDTTSWSTYISSFKFPDCVAGPSGVISGTVTDAESDEPISGVSVTVGATTITTDIEGNYRLNLPVGDDYDVSFFKYGWEASFNEGIDVAEDQEIDLDVSLTAQLPVTVTGRVTDGAGLGVNLYAKVRVNAPGTVLTTTTNPVTGEYSIDLFEGTLVKLTASAMIDGYLDSEADILPGNISTQDFALNIDSACIAPGYATSTPSFLQGFDSGVPPTGWTVQDDAGNSVLWSNASSTSLGNILGTDGEAAAVDSDAAGNVLVDTSLTSPVINVADISDSNLFFVSIFRTYSGGDAFDVEINVDNGGWTALYSVPSTGNNSVVRHQVDMSTQLTGATSFQLRWRYYNAVFEWYAYVDDVQIGLAQCVVQPGTLVNGLVKDANTGEPLVGASISAGANTTVSIATANDVNLSDGYFSLFVPATEDSVVIAAKQYESQTTAIADLDFAIPVELEAGRLEVAESASFSITAGRTAEDIIAIENVGNVDAEYFIALTQAPRQFAANNFGPFDPSSRHFGPKNLTDVNTKKMRDQRDYSQLNVTEKNLSQIVGAFGIGGSFGIAVNQNNNDFWTGETTALNSALESAVRYDANGSLTGESIDTSAIPSQWNADMTFNHRTGMLWQVAVGDANNCIYELNPIDFVVTGNSICPGVGVSQRGLTYDPITNTFYSGSWNDSIIHQFTTDGTLLRSVNVGLTISGLALNPSSGRLYVQSNSAAPNFDIVVLNANTASLDPIEAFNYPAVDVNQDGEPDDLMPDNSQAGLTVGCDGTLWGISMDFSAVIGVSTGDDSVCSWKNVNGFKLAGTGGTVAANTATDAALGFDASQLAVGRYDAQLVIDGNTPYGDKSVLVTLNVTAPQRGAFEFARTDYNVSAGREAKVAINRVGGSDFAASVDYIVVEGSAVAGTDYVAIPNGTVSWEDGDSTTQYITIQTNSTREDVSKELSIVIVNVEGATMTEKSAKVTIFNRRSGGGLGIGLFAMFGLLVVLRRRSVNA